MKSDLLADGGNWWRCRAWAVLPNRRKYRAEEVALGRDQPGLDQRRKAAHGVLAEDPGNLAPDLHPMALPGLGMVPEVVERHRPGLVELRGRGVRRRWPCPPGAARYAVRSASPSWVSRSSPAGWARLEPRFWASKSTSSQSRCRGWSANRPFMVGLRSWRRGR